MADISNSFKPVDQFGFDNRLKLATYLYSHSGSYSVYISGAPEAVIEKSKCISKSGIITEINDSDKLSIISALDQFSEMGERTIGIAYAHGRKRETERSNLEMELTFIGLISFMDPPRREIKKSIMECQEAGIRVLMITGDHPKTAISIAKQIGINNSFEAITGSELKQMSDNQVLDATKKTTIFARITSEDKLRIVNLLESTGETVAVTGDGVNDAPALRSAKIGIAMGIRGTDVAKESSDIILADDNFSTIVKAIQIGRQINQTLRKSVTFYVTVQFALVSMFLVPLALSLPFPLSPIQIVIIEFLMDIGALWGFTSEPPEEGLMEGTPRNTQNRFIDARMKKNIAMATVGLVIAVMGLYIYTIYTSENIIEAQAIAFSTWVLSQVVFAQNMRTESESVIRRGFFSNLPLLIWAVAVIFVFILIAFFPVLEVITRTSYITYRDWLLIIPAAIASTSWMEIFKFRNKEGNKHQNPGRINTI